MKEDNKKAVSVKFKLCVGITELVIVICLVLGLVSYFLTYNAISQQINSKLSQKRDDVSKYISSYVNSRKTEIKGIAALPDIMSMDWNVQKNILVNENKELGFDKMAVVDLKSAAHTTVNDKILDVSKVDYAQSCLKGEEGFSDPKISTVNGNLIMDIYVPIKNENKAVVGGLIATFNITKLNDVLQQLQTSSSEYSYVVNKEGTVILHKEANYVKNKFNAIKSAEKDASYKQLADCVKEMIAGKTDVKQYKLDKQYISAYSPIDGMNWYIAVDADKTVSYAAVNNLAVIEIIITIIFILVGAVDGLFISIRITKPIVKIKNMADKLAEYDFNTTIDMSNQAREYIQIGEALDKAQQEIKILIKGIMTNSEELSASSEELSATSEELFSQFESVSSSTESIVDGTQEISASAEEVTASVQEIDENVRKLSDKAAEGSNKSNEIKDRALSVQQNVKSVINNSRGIYREKEAKIVKSIQDAEVVEEVKAMANAIADIAEQTNLLALNAAIEAARAGEQGKGFAVVAEEVRKLAEESSQTVGMIQNTIPKIQAAFKYLSLSGQDLLKYINEDVNKQYDSYLSTGEQYYKDAEYMSEMSKNILIMAEQINVSIEQVNKVVQTVADNSQKSSVSTDEISSSIKEASSGMEQIAKTTQSQAELAQYLNESVQKFKI